MDEVLGTATLGQLVGELERRFPRGLVVAGVKEWKGDPQSDEFFMDYRGGLTSAIGCAARAVDLMHDDARGNVVSEEGGAEG